MGLVLDTGILISTERQGRSPQLLFEDLYRTHGEIDISISVITILELDHGIYRASSPQQASKRRRFCDDVCRIAAVSPVTLEIARLAGHIEGEQAAKGVVIGLADLLIACTALVSGDSVLTLNVKRFEEIPGLNVLIP